MVKNSRITRAERMRSTRLLSPKRVGEAVRQGQALRFFSVWDPQPVGDPAPVEAGTAMRPMAIQGLGDAADEDGARQAHQEPATHVGGTGGEGGHPVPHGRPPRM